MTRLRDDGWVKNGAAEVVPLYAAPLSKSAPSGTAKPEAPDAWLAYRMIKECREYEIAALFKNTLLQMGYYEHEIQPLYLRATSGTAMDFEQWYAREYGHDEPDDLAFRTTLREVWDAARRTGNEELK
jgi:hypothetical protein